MAGPVELIPLVCIRCGTRLPAEPNEVAWVCPQCGQGQQIDAGRGLVALEVQYAAGIAPGAKGKPFWVARGQAAVQRHTYSGNQDNEAQRFWAQAHTFYVPAFDTSLETLVTLGRQAIERPPVLQPGPAVPFEAVKFSVEDVQPLAEYIVIGLEADRKDKLKELNVRLTLETPTLWILP